MGGQSRVSIGDYHILKTLGTGATGKVKLARHPHTNELVALKIIRKDLLLRKRNLFEKVHREIAVMKLIAGSCLAVDQTRRQMASFLPSSLQNAQVGVLKLLDVYDTETSFVLVLEYCEGGELFDLLVEQGYLPEELVLDLFQQLVHALEFCHDRGICHRDLKPENVLLMSDGRIKLADFGMSSVLTPGALLETSCGSPQYCAPEVISGEAYEGHIADVWSLGVVLYAMTTGGLPFDDDNFHRFASKANSGAFYMPEAVPEDLAEIIRWMLTVDPRERATLEDIKQSSWFNSQPCRDDIYREGMYSYVKPVTIADNQPIEEPDKEIVRYLRDLGMGEASKIHFRLAADEHCLERSFYYQLLHLCGDSLAFQPRQDMPPLPNSLTSGDEQLGKNVKNVNVLGPREWTSERTAERVQVAAERFINPCGQGVSLSRSWVDHLAGALTSNDMSTVVTVHPLEAVAGMQAVSTLRSVTSA